MLESFNGNGEYEIKSRMWSLRAVLSSLYDRSDSTIIVTGARHGQGFDGHDSASEFFGRWQRPPRFRVPGAVNFGGTIE